MGEAKRRAAAAPHAKTTAQQVLRKMKAAIAALPPAPMRGAISLDLSSADHAELLRRADVLSVDLRGGFSLDGIGLRVNPLLTDGVMLGRDRNGRVVWSSKLWMQEAIDGGFSPWPDIVREVQP